MSVQPNDWLQWASDRSDARAIRCEGDSYLGGPGTPLDNTLRADTGRVTISTAVGGSTRAEQVARIIATPYLRAMPVFWWDGSANSYGSVAADLASIDQAVAYIGAADKFIILAPLAIGPPSGSTAAFLSDMQAIYAGIVSRGIRTFDVQSFLVALNDPADSTSTAAGLVGPTSTSDGVHLTDALKAQVATQIEALITW